MLFDSWAGLGRVVLVGALAYAALVLLLRIFGQAHADQAQRLRSGGHRGTRLDLATVLLSKSVALAEGVLALGLLIFLQYAIAWLSVRSPRFQSFIKAEPTLLLHRGRFLEGAMRAQRITREEVLAALRASGAAEVGEIAAVVLETDGSISVIPDAGAAGDGGTLANVEPLDRGARARGRPELDDGGRV